MPWCTIALVQTLAATTDGEELMKGVGDYGVCAHIDGLKQAKGASSCILQQNLKFLFRGSRQLVDFFFLYHINICIESYCKVKYKAISLTLCWVMLSPILTFFLFSWSIHEREL